MPQFRVTAAPFVPVSQLCRSLSLALLLGACTADKTRESGVVVRDSAGVRIAESSAPASTLDEALALAPEPTVAIGGEDEAAEYQFGRVAAATRLSDGRIAVFDGMANELRFYGADGRFLSKRGGRGGGPGEYQFVSWMHRLPGDSLMLHDLMAQRITVLASNGTVGRTINLSAAAADAPAPAAAPSGERRARIRIGAFGRYRALAPFADGSLLATVAGAGAPTGGQVTRDSVVYVRLAADGSLRDTLGTFVGDEAQVSTLDGGERRMMMIAPPPFGRTTQVVADDDGFWLGTTDRYEIGRYDVNGRLVQLIRRPVAPLAVTDEDVAERKRLDLERTVTMRGVDEAAHRRMIETRWEGATIPKVMPAHGTLMTDGAGRLWVRETARPADLTSRWTVFEADGTMLGTITMPEQFRPLEFGNDYVLGVRRDELDVEHVELYALRPAASAS